MSKNQVEMISTMLADKAVQLVMETHFGHDGKVSIREVLITTAAKIAASLISPYSTERNVNFWPNAKTSFMVQYAENLNHAIQTESSIGAFEAASEDAENV